MNMKK